MHSSTKSGDGHEWGIDAVHRRLHARRGHPGPPPRRTALRTGPSRVPVTLGTPSTRLGCRWHRKASSKSLPCRSGERLLPGCRSQDDAVASVCETPLRKGPEPDNCRRATAPSRPAHQLQRQLRPRHRRAALGNGGLSRLIQIRKQPCGSGNGTLRLLLPADPLQVGSSRSDPTTHAVSCNDSPELEQAPRRARDFAAGGVFLNTAANKRFKPEMLGLVLAPGI